MGFKPWTFDYRGRRRGVRFGKRRGYDERSQVYASLCLKRRIQRNEYEHECCEMSTNYPTANGLAFRWTLKLLAYAFNIKVTNILLNNLEDALISRELSARSSLALRAQSANRSKSASPFSSTAASHVPILARLLPVLRLHPPSPVAPP